MLSMVHQGVLLTCHEGVALCLGERELSILLHCGNLASPKAPIDSKHVHNYSTSLHSIAMQVACYADKYIATRMRRILLYFTRCHADMALEGRQPGLLVAVIVPALLSHPCCYRSIAA
jgi:hypothetical protein